LLGPGEPPAFFVARALQLQRDARLEGRLGRLGVEGTGARCTELQSSIDILRRQMEQRQQEILELTSRTAKLQESLTLAREELNILRPMVERGVSSRVELMRVERQVTDLEREQEAARLAMPRVQSTLAETRRRIEERQATFQSAAQNELTDARMRLSALNESISAVADRVRRTEVMAPVRGMVKLLKVNTVGGVIQPGMDLVEIAPLEKSLLDEASIRPQDIAFLRPGQDAKVNVTAMTSRSTAWSSISAPTPLLTRRPRDKASSRSACARRAVRWAAPTSHCRSSPA